jgi:hypothetical protein
MYISKWRTATMTMSARAVLGARNEGRALESSMEPLRVGRIDRGCTVQLHNFVQDDDDQEEGTEAAEESVAEDDEARRKAYLQLPQEFTDQVQILYVENENAEIPPVKEVFQVVKNIKATKLLAEVNGKPERYWTKKRVWDLPLGSPIRVVLYNETIDVEHRFMAFEIAWVEPSVIALARVDR